MSRRILAACILTWASAALAGAWDIGSFDNDDALDWVWELSESSDLSVVESTLQAAADAPGYLEAPTASMAIAAAEVVAALRGNPRPGLPDEVSKWVNAHSLDVGEDLLTLARTAIENVRKLESSELAQLWSESEELAKAWRADLTDLQEHLE